MLDADAEARVLDAVDLEGLLGLLTRLVEIPSVDGRETEAQRSMAEAMDELGLAVDLWEIDFEQLARHPDFSVEIPREHGLGLVGSLGESGNGRDLIFNGHIDVVPPGNLDDWTVPPWQGTRKEGRIWGRGALDMKGGLCCAVYAAHAIRSAGIELDGRLMVESVIGEEDGGCGTLATSLRGYRADGAVIPEPTELTVAPAQAGCCNFRLIVRGLSAHGCIRHEGVSALEKLWPLHRALVDFERRYNEDHRHPLFDSYQLPYPLSIGTVRAGDWASSVPDTLICEGRFGVAVDQEPSEARGELEEVIAEAAAQDPWLRDHPPEVEWWGGQFAPALTDPEHPVVTAVAGSATDRLGQLPRQQGMTYGADMRLLQRVAETPTVMFGPGDIRRAHRPDEWVAIDDLRVVTEVLALTALRFCGVR